MIAGWWKSINKDDPARTKKQKKFCFISFAVISFIIGMAFLIKFGLSYLDGLTEAQKLKALYENGQAASSQVIVPSETEQLVPAGTVKPENIAPQKEASPEEKKTILPQYNELINVNSEVIGWIKVDGTRIDYPLLQHDDNEYYLHMNIENKKSKRGCVYIDYRNNSELTDKNTLIYAHNMKDGSMFRDLVSYKKRSFFDSHRTIHISNIYEEGLWEVFSVYVVDADKETIDIDYSKEGSFINAMDGFKKRSMFKTNTTIESGDRIATLVTCSYETSNSRTIVHAKYIGKILQP